MISKSLALSVLAALIGFATTACNKPQSHTLEALSGADSIVGGIEVKADDDIARYIVGIGHPKYGLFCTGVLVKKNVVITAAHCTDLGNQVREHYVLFGRDLKGALETRKVLGGKTTDRWPTLKEDDFVSETTEWGDIAMIKFEGEAPAGYEPARILGNAAKLEKGMDVILAGYGLTSYAPRVESDKLLKTVVKLTNPQHTPSELLFEQFEGRGSCKGDSGGPAFTTINNKLFLIGITSRAAQFDEKTLCQAGSIYTSVAAHIRFLVATAKFFDSSSFVPGQTIPQPE